jgi:hypothetical protein
MHLNWRWPQIHPGVNRDSLQVQPYSQSADIKAFSNSFSLAVASEDDPQATYSDLFLGATSATVEQHINNEVVLHPATLIALVRQITNRLCLPQRYWEAFQSIQYRLCILLVKLYVHSANHDKNQELQFAVSIGLAASTFTFVDCPGWTGPAAG